MDNDDHIIRFIEFDGIQHSQPDEYFNDFENIQKRDQQKNIYCQEKQIPLVRIPYYKRDSITLEDLMGDRFLI